MKLRVFQADKGDCLLLTSTSGRNLLVDGGMPDAFVAHVAPYLADMAAQQEVLDLVYVSHIDQDHIGGIVQLLDAVMAWRVYDYRSAQGAKVKPPTLPRMPPVRGLWHNAFSDMVGKNAAAAGDLLAQSASLLAQARGEEFAPFALENSQLAASVSEAIQVSHRVSADQLAIPLNAEFDGRLAMVREPAGPEAALGGMKISVVGPFEEDLDVLKADWNRWLKANQEAVARLRNKARADAARISDVALDIELKELGRRSMVTPPNLASLMLLVQEGKQRILLTGDGHADDILAGLEHQGVLVDDDTIHVNILKVQHHGSEHNIHSEFCRRVTADHYVFCGNGKHENPDLEVLQMLFDTNSTHRPKAKYKLWFNCDAQQAPAGAPRKHMQQLTKLVDAQVAGSGGRIRAQYLSKSSFLIQ